MNEPVELAQAKATRLVRHRPGLMAYTSPKGIRVVVLRIGADPEEDTPEKLGELRRSLPTTQWRREMEGDWTTPAGKPFFPDFNLNGGRDRYVHRIDSLIPGEPVLRSFDTGARRPVCTWMQWSPKSRRMFLIREFMPNDLLAHQFLRAMKFLSGEILFDDVPGPARPHIEKYAAKYSGAHCPPPWFPQGTPFINVAGNEALITQANARTKEEATVAQIFAAEGVPLHICNPRVVARNRFVASLLTIRDDGWPGLLIDPQCEQSITGFEGAFTYPKETPANPVPVHPHDDGEYINILDAIGYGVTAVVNPDESDEKPESISLGFMDDETYFARGGL